MTLANYSDLTSAIASWLNRSDLTSQIPDFVALLESRLNRELRVRQMETTDTSVTVAGTDTYALPTDWLEFRNLKLNTSPPRLLEYRNPAESEFATWSDQTGEPRYFYVVGSNYRLIPTPDSVYTVARLYYTKIPGLQANSTNWLMTAYPDIYLFGSLLEAADFVMNIEMRPVWQARFDASMAMLRMADERARWNSGPLVVRPGVVPI